MKLRLLLLTLSVAIFLATGEAALRVVYRDAGKTTLGGPGGHAFEHLTVSDDLRGRFDVGPKPPGVPRIMILGDSISWGQGVRHWQETWPEQLARALERAGRRHEMAVFARPGRDIVTHVGVLAESAQTVKPDILIYQWYVNDVEVMEHRPPNVRWWQRWSGHDWLRTSSYLYYFVDNRLSSLLPQPDRSYVDYVLQDFTPGSLEWAEFERYFHALAARAREIAPARMLMIYPQVPFRGTSPLQPVYDRVRAMAGSHRLVIPPRAWIRFSGTLVEPSDARWKQVLEVPEAAAGPVIETRDYYMSPGSTELIATVARDRPSQNGAVALDVIDHASNQVLASAALLLPAPASGWQEIAVRPIIPGAVGRAVRFRVSSPGFVGFTLASLDVPVDYGMTVVDLTEPLNTFNTHASLFDAHPNERAHRVMAAKVFEALQKPAAAH